VTVLCIGGKCGGTSIDRALHTLMEERYGEAFSSLPYAKIGPGSSFIETFEKWKRIFTNNDLSQIWELPLKMPALEKHDPEPMQYDVGEDKTVLTWYDSQ
jgi:hypothetical protein